MSKASKKLLTAAAAAVDVASGTKPAARITVKGHTYVPLKDYEALQRRNRELTAILRRVRKKPGGLTWIANR